MAYYQDEIGKTKKRIQNRKRPTARQKTARVPGDTEGGSRVLLQHVRRVVSAIEGRRVSQEEVRVMLLRQHSIGRSQDSCYDTDQPDERPP